MSYPNSAFINVWVKLLRATAFAIVVAVGISKPIVMGVSARASFNRSDFGMNYAVDKNLVGNNIDLIIEFEARKQ